MNDRENLLIHSYFALTWWSESINSNFFQSDYFKEMHFTDDYVKKQLSKPNIAAGSLIMPSLYVCLLLTKETIEENYDKEFAHIDNIFSHHAEGELNKVEILKNTHPFYLKEKNHKSSKPISYTRHLRNAVSHNRLKITKTSIEYQDVYPKDESKEISIRVNKEVLIEVVRELQLILMKHVQYLQQQEPQQ